MILIMSQKVIKSTTQKFTDIYDISNNMVMSYDGNVSMILSVGAMNFGLLAEEEQDAVIYGYAGLLNSLNYPIQIIIQSKTKDVTSYLNLLKQQEQKASSAQKQVLISQYRQFVSELIKERNVLDKKFFVVVTANPLELGLLSAKTVIPGQKKVDLESREKSVILEKAESILVPRRDHLISQFARIGLFCRQLSTQEIVQIFYINYNPEATEGQQLSKTKDYTTPLVKASISGGYMQDKPNPLVEKPNQQGANQPTAQNANQTAQATAQSNSPAQESNQPGQATQTQPVNPKQQMPQPATQTGQTGQQQQPPVNTQPGNTQPGNAQTGQVNSQSQKPQQNNPVNVSEQPSGLKTADQKQQNVPGNQTTQKPNLAPTPKLQKNNQGLKQTLPNQGNSNPADAQLQNEVNNTMAQLSQNQKPNQQAQPQQGQPQKLNVKPLGDQQ